jgi:hypothetical protein
MQSKAFVYSLLERLAARHGAWWFTAGRSVLFMRSPCLLRLLQQRLCAALTLQRWWRRTLLRRAGCGEPNTASTDHRVPFLGQSRAEEAAARATRGEASTSDRARPAAAYGAGGEREREGEAGLAAYTRALESELHAMQAGLGLHLADADVRVEFWKRYRHPSHSKPVPTTPYRPGGGTTAHSILTSPNKPVPTTPLVQEEVLQHTVY